MKSVGVVVILIATTLGYTQAPDTLWTITYGDTAEDCGYSVQQTFDNGYIVVGETQSFGAGDADVWLLKTDANGDTLWTRTYGGIYFDAGYSVQQAADSGYVIAGETRSFGDGEADLWLIKTDIQGDTQWTKTYGGQENDGGCSVQKTTDGGYIIAGYTESFGAGSRDVWLLRTDANGDTLWAKTYGGGDYDTGKSVQQTFDGGYIIFGNSTWLAFWLIKTNAFGDTIWTKIYNVGGRGASIQQTVDSGYIAVGTVGMCASTYVLKTDSNGDSLWTQGGFAWHDGAEDIKQTSDSGYILTGWNDGLEGFSIMKLDENGDYTWILTCAGRGGNAIQQTSDGGYIAVGSRSQDVYLVKTEQEVGIDEDERSIVNNSGITTTIFHGPLQLPKDKECKVFDITGRVVEPKKIQPGIYFIEVDGVVTQKVVKVR